MAMSLRKQQNKVYWKDPTKEVSHPPGLVGRALG